MTRQKKPQYQNARRRALRADLDRVIKRAWKEGGGESIVTLHSAILHSAKLLREIFESEEGKRAEWEMAVKGQVSQLYLNMIHSAELYYALDLYCRGMKAKKAVSVALHWRNDPKCPPIEETIILSI